MCRVTVRSGPEVQEADVIQRGDTVTSLFTGERITVLGTPEDTEGGYLEWEDIWPARHPRSASHVHPAMEERWIVLEGRMCFEIGGRRIAAVAGDEVVAAAGTPHRAWNDGVVEARMIARMTPGGRWAQVIERLFALESPTTKDLEALFRDFPDEITVPRPPARSVHE
jgi:mannose-6-phosphate isomerase-like protein (cupin superfamily)